MQHRYDILIVDNIENNRYEISSLLQENYDILEAESNDTAINLILNNKNSLALIIIAVSAPKIDGFKILTELKELRLLNKIPVIFISDESFLKDERKSYELGVSDILKKPFEPYTFKRRVDNIVELYSHKNDLEQLVCLQNDKLISQTNKINEQIEQMNKIATNMIEVLSSTIEHRDSESGMHIHRIRYYTKAILKVVAKEYPEYNLTDEKIDMISLASTVHDIGKISIPDSILLKPGRLTNEEYEIIKTHTVKGCEILAFMKGMENSEYLNYCNEICHYHHEKWDGKGYPEGLKGDQIPLSAQVTSLADCYDALISERSYKKNISHEHAIMMIKTGACGEFSPKMINCLDKAQYELKRLAEQYADIKEKTRSKLYKYYNKSVLEEESIEKNSDSDSVLLNLYDYVFECDIIRNTFKSLKGAWNKLFGYIPMNYNEAVAQCYSALNPENAERFIALFGLNKLKKLLEKGENRVTDEIVICNADGKNTYMLLTIVMFTTEDKRLKKIMGFLQKLNDSGIEKDYISNYDDLTGLYNGQSFEDAVNEYIQYEGKDLNSALIQIDIDDLRKINELVSHQFGDQVLKDTAEALKSLFPTGTILGRISSDNFCALLKNYNDSNDLIIFIDKLHKELQKTYIIKNEELNFTVSIGIACYPEYGNDYSKLSSNSEFAKNIAKIEGKNIYVFFNDRMKEINKINSIYSYLSLGENNESIIEPLFIPVVKRNTQRIIQFDCLYVLNNDIQPDTQIEFFYDAWLRSGKNIKMGLSLLKQNFELIHHMMEQGFEIPPISIYTLFTASDTETFLRKIDESVKRYNINCENVCINLISDMIDEMENNEVIKLVSYLKAMNFKVGIYRIGYKSINIACLKENLFDNIVFSINFINQAFEDEYLFNNFVNILNCFKNTQLNVIIPDKLDSNKLDLLCPKTDVDFCTYIEPFVKMEELGKIEYEGYEQKPCKLKYRPSLRISENRYNEIFEKSRTVIFEWKPKENTVSFSKTFEQIYGYFPKSEGFLDSIKNSDIVYSEEKKVFTEALLLVQTEPYKEFSARIKRVKNSKISYIWNKFSLIAINDKFGVTTRVIGFGTDVDNEIKETQNLRVKAEMDLHTMLFNKAATEKYIGRYIKGEGLKGSHAFLIIDIDDFKGINDGLGHNIGDSILKNVSLHIKRIIRDIDICGRIGGDEFVVFLKNISNIKHITDKVKLICDLVCNEFENKNLNRKISVSIGISLYPQHGRTYEELYINADRALYYVKENGKNGWAVYNNELLEKD